MQLFCSFIIEWILKNLTNKITLDFLIFITPNPKIAFLKLFLVLRDSSHSVNVLLPVKQTTRTQIHERMKNINWQRNALQITSTGKGICSTLKWVHPCASSLIQNSCSAIMHGECKKKSQIALWSVTRKHRVAWWSPPPQIDCRTQRVQIMNIASERRVTGPHCLGGSRLKCI
jgi:hypothetical protein